jgi:hypothetical protein
MQPQLRPSGCALSSTTSLLAGLNFNDICGPACANHPNRCPLTLPTASAPPAPIQHTHTPTHTHLLPEARHQRPQPQQAAQQLPQHIPQPLRLLPQQALAQQGGQVGGVGPQQRVQVTRRGGTCLEGLPGACKGRVRGTGSSLVLCQSLC